jgi:hypothetical protein
VNDTVNHTTPVPPPSDGYVFSFLSLLGSEWTSSTSFYFQNTSECLQATALSMEPNTLPISKNISRLSLNLIFEKINTFEYKNFTQLQYPQLLFTEFVISTTYRPIFPCFQKFFIDRYVPIVRDKTRRNKMNDESEREYSSRLSSSEPIQVESNYHFNDLFKYNPETIFGYPPPPVPFKFNFEFICKYEIDYDVLTNLTGLNIISKNWISSSM